MRIPKRLELHLAAGKDDAMNYDVIRVVEGRLCATDGTVVASVPIGPGAVTLEAGEELPEGARIEPRAWAEASRGSRGEGTLRLRLGEQVAASAADKPSLTFPAPGAARTEVPPVKLALSEARNVLSAPRTASVVLDAEALLRLSRALGAGEGVRLTFEGGGEGVHVEPAEGGGAYGLIMAIRREGRG